MSENIRGDVITKEGRGTKFDRDTGRPCPDCGHKDGGGTLHVRSDIENTAQLECPNCGYIENVPSDTIKEIRDIRGQIIKRP